MLINKKKELCLTLHHGLLFLLAPLCFAHPGMLLRVSGSQQMDTSGMPPARMPQHKSCPCLCAWI